MQFGGTKVQAERVSSYITPGIQEATISGITGEINKNGNPVVTIMMYPKGGDDKNANKFLFFFNSDKATEFSLRKIQHIATKIVKEDKYLAVTADNIEEYAEGLNNLLAGHSLRMKFCGEQYIKQDSSIGVRANVGLPSFAEAIQEGAEYPVVEASMSKLTYDVNNAYDFKKLAATPEAPITSGDASTDLPF